MKTIDEEWRDFASRIPTYTGACQRTAIRRAYYAGAIAVIRLVEKGTPMKQLSDEVLEFIDQVAEGEA